ncbi:hypothetical protein GQ53DRAFT_320294 [Thozetella sp. PMI_491]|nr:hypothetical protein GQ53DRAFT_320294 [Thozetella sp. PMI_491]
MLPSREDPVVFASWLIFYLFIRIACEPNPRTPCVPQTRRGTRDDKLNKTKSGAKEEGDCMRARYCTSGLRVGSRTVAPLQTGPNRFDPPETYYLLHQCGASHRGQLLHVVHRPKEISSTPPLLPFPSPGCLCHPHPCPSLDAWSPLMLSNFGRACGTMA